AWHVQLKQYYMDKVVDSSGVTVPLSPMKADVLDKKQKENSAASSKHHKSHKHDKRDKHDKTEKHDKERHDKHKHKSKKDKERDKEKDRHKENSSKEIKKVKDDKDKSKDEKDKKRERTEKDEADRVKKRLRLDSNSSSDGQNSVSKSDSKPGSESEPKKVKLELTTDNQKQISDSSPENHSSVVNKSQSSESLGKDQSESRDSKVCENDVVVPMELSSVSNSSVAECKVEIEKNNVDEKISNSETIMAEKHNADKNKDSEKRVKGEKLECVPLKKENGNLDKSVGSINSGVLKSKTLLANVSGAGPGRPKTPSKGGATTVSGGAATGTAKTDLLDSIMAGMSQPGHHK
ncbi:unnamed protein product, partial [Meganyctiphanes norvegica]